MEYHIFVSFLIWWQKLHSNKIELVFLSNQTFWKGGISYIHLVELVTSKNFNIRCLGFQTHDTVAKSVYAPFWYLKNVSLRGFCKSEFSIFLLLLFLVKKVSTPRGKKLLVQTEGFRGSKSNWKRIVALRKQFSETFLKIDHISEYA